VDFDRTQRTWLDLPLLLLMLLLLHVVMRDHVENDWIGSVYDSPYSSDGSIKLHVRSSDDEVRAVRSFYFPAGPEFRSR